MLQSGCSWARVEVLLVPGVETLNVVASGSESYWFESFYYRSISSIWTPSDGPWLHYGSDVHCRSINTELDE